MVLEKTNMLFYITIAYILYNGLDYPHMWKLYQSSIKKFVYQYCIKEFYLHFYFNI